MSEFLIRRWNAAIPEVDVGDDIFVVQDDSGTLRRVQVKTSTAMERQKSFSRQFKIPVAQLRDYRVNFPIYYVFIARHKGVWTKPIIVKQDYLLDYFENGKIGSPHNGNLNLYFSYGDNQVECSGYDFTKYITDYTDFPVIEH